ncbi:low affinity iron permease family protein [Kitasatospora sp. NPDC004240]
MRVRHPADREGGGRGFERLAEAASNFTASRTFSLFCFALVAGFIAVHVAGLGLHWQLIVADTMTAVTLLLLALLKNSERRAEHAIQRKLDALATALLEEKEGEDRDARKVLDDAIGMDEEL